MGILGEGKRLLKVLSAKLGYHLVPVSERSWLESSIPSIGSVSEGIRELSQTKVVVFQHVDQVSR